jgi:hypothetical protein
MRGLLILKKDRGMMHVSLSFVVHRYIAIFTVVPVVLDGLMVACFLLDLRLAGSNPTEDDGNV